jgi:hypothetical protein
MPANGRFRLSDGEIEVAPRVRASHGDPARVCPGQARPEEGPLLSGDVDIDRMVIALEETATTLRADAVAPAGSMHTIRLKDAAYIAGVSEAQMRKRCEENIHSFHPGGYGLKRDGSNRWEVVFAPFIATVPVGALLRVK